MSASPFFQSAGRGDLKFWGEDDGHIIVVWEMLSESEQEQSVVEKDGQVEELGGLVQVKNEEQHPVEVKGKEIFLDRSKQANPKAGEKTYKRGGKGKSVRWKAWWRQGNIKCAVSEEYASCWVHQDCHVADK